MKTLKLAGIIIAFVFAVNFNSLAQEQVTEVCQTAWIDWVPCADEAVTGELIACYRTWENGKTQDLWKGTFVGVESGKIYTFSRVQNNDKFDATKPGAHLYQTTSSGSVECEGVVIGSYHMTWHGTYNASGDLVSELHKGEWWFNCN